MQHARESAATERPPRGHRQSSYKRKSEKKREKTRKIRKIRLRKTGGGHIVANSADRQLIRSNCPERCRCECYGVLLLLKGIGCQLQRCALHACTHHTARDAGDVGFELTESLHRADGGEHLGGQLDQRFVGDEALAVDELDADGKTNTCFSHFYFG